MRTWLIGGILLVALVGAGCGGETGSGNVKTESRNVNGFDSVDLLGFGTLSIRQADADSLQVQADDNLLPRITSQVVGSTLKLGIEPGTTISPTTLNYVVTVRRLRAIGVSGIGRVTATEVESPAVSVALSGAGNLTVSGRAGKETVHLSGAGSYDGSNLASQDAEVTVSGAGTAVVNASHTLDAQVDGAGNVEYLGSPAVTRRVSGAGTIRRRS